MNSLYYTNTSHDWASRLALKARRKIYWMFITRCLGQWSDEILDVGMTCDTSRPESNFLEQWYPWKHRIVGCGTEFGHHLAEHYGINRFVQVTPGQPLPFADKQFPVVFCNAVVEHVGSDEQQRRFVSELLRVGQRVFLTTPNRWHPMEFHSCLPLLHWFPKPVHRLLLKVFGMGHWARESNLNLLTSRELQQLFGQHRVEINRISLARLTTNLVAIRR